MLGVDELLKPVPSKQEQERIDKIKEEATLMAINMVRRNIEEGIEPTSGKFCFFKQNLLRLFGCLCLEFLLIFNK